MPGRDNLHTSRGSTAGSINEKRETGNGTRHTSHKRDKKRVILTVRITHTLHTTERFQLLCKRLFEGFQLLFIRAFGARAAFADGGARAVADGDRAGIVGRVQRGRRAPRREP